MHIKLENNKITYPPINKGNICNYNLATDLLEADGYIDIDENLIDLFNEGKGKIENNTIIDISQTIEYITMQEQKEQKRIASMTMTALDFIQVLKNAGLASKQIKEYLDVNIELDMQLKYCQNVYCGVVCQLCPLTIGDITLTQDMIIKAFKIKNNEEV